MTDQNTFLRGGVPTNENGILEFKTIYPGFCESLMTTLGLLGGMITDWCGAVVQILVVRFISTRWFRQSK